jgi:hypothetical protein
VSQPKKIAPSTAPLFRFFTGAEHVERQITVAIIIAVEEPPLLLAMHRGIRRIEVENDLSERPLVRLHEQVDQQILDGHRM